MIFKNSYKYIIFLKLSKKLKRFNYFNIFSLLFSCFLNTETKTKQIYNKISFIVFGEGANFSTVFFFFIVVIKNLLRVFYRRYRTVILRKRLFRILGKHRFQILKWSAVIGYKVNAKFSLPLIFGSRTLLRQFKRQEWLFLLKFGVDNEKVDFNLKLYFDFLKKVIKFFPKRRLLLQNKVFICRLRQTRNNFFLTFYFINGRALVSVSVGGAGFSGKKKRTPLAAKKAAIMFSKKVRFVLSKLKVKVEGSFFIIKLYGRASSAMFKEALNGLRIEKFPCNLIIDSKAVSHGGIRRLKKPRRV
jgi:ribosomal protein S11